MSQITSKKKTIIHRYKLYLFLSIFTFQHNLATASQEGNFISILSMNSDLLPTDHLNMSRQQRSHFVLNKKTRRKKRSRKKPQKISEEEKAAIARQKNLEKERKEAFSVDQYRYLDLHFLIASESLSIAGVEGSFEGKTLVGGGGGQFLMLNRESTQFFPDAIQMTFHAHSFITEQKTTLEDTQLSSVTTAKYNRMNLSFLALYEIIPIRKPRLYLGMGGGLLQIPTVDKDFEDSEEKFSSRIINDMGFSLLLDYSLANNSSMFIDVKVFPITLSGDVQSLKKFIWEFGAKSFIFSNIYGRFSVFYQKESLSTDIDCHQENCSTSGQTSSQMTGSIMGLGFYF